MSGSGGTITPEQYLRTERVAERKADYFAGRTYAFAGASRRHNVIVVNLIAALHTQLRDSPCSVYGSDMRLRVTASGLSHWLIANPRTGTLSAFQGPVRFRGLAMARSQLCGVRTDENDLERVECYELL